MRIYKILQLFRNIFTTGKTRLAKEIILDQINQNKKYGIYENWRKAAAEVNVHLDVSEITNMQKSEWKNLIKDQINKTITQQRNRKKRTSEKLRFITIKNGQVKEKYTNNCNIKDTKRILKAKLNMNKSIASFSCCIYYSHEQTEHMYKK